MNRQETLSKLKEQPNISVLIVGGGVNGISTFRELALQGVDVLLAEKADFCSGASAASSHMMHGGLRYLENAEFRLVQEALTERNRLLQNAPHYVKPLPTTIPIFKWMSGTLNAPLKFLGLTSKPRERGAFIIKLGLMMYDAFAATQRSMPTHKFLSKEESLRRFPGINKDINVTATYYDAWMPYPERICMELIFDAEAANENARAVNYLGVVNADGDTVTLEDELTNTTYEIKPQIVVNAAGPWIDIANQNMSRDTNFIGGTKGSHLVIDHPDLYNSLNGNEIFFENDDGRIVLIFPLEDRVLAGTTDIRVDNPDKAVCTEDEIQYILSLIGKVFPDLHVERDHVVFTFSGVRPLPSQDAATTGQISRDHSIRTLEPGSGTTFPIHSLIGGKWTTFRAFGEQTADKVLQELGVPRQLDTQNMPIGGGKDFPTSDRDRTQWVSSVASKYGLTTERVETLLNRYGTVASEIAAFISEEEDAPLQYMPDYSRREVIYITRYEKTMTVQDLVLRRSLLAMLGKISVPLLAEIADIMGNELGWNETDRQRSVDQTMRRLMIRNLVEVTHDGVKLVSAGPSGEGGLKPIPESVLVADQVN